MYTGASALRQNPIVVVYATVDRVGRRVGRWRVVIFGLVVLLHPTRVSAGVVVGALDLNSNPVDVVRARLYDDDNNITTPPDRKLFSGF